MRRQFSFYQSAALALILVAGLTCFAATPQDDSKKKKEAAPTGTPVLWREPADVTALDLLAGPGGEGMKPDLSSVTYIRDETGGYSVKYRVRDGAGKIWVAKVGNEAQPETAAARLVWAAGYVTEVNYLAPCVVIKGATKPRKDVKRCAGGGFANVRFEARPAEYKRLDMWGWKENPFAATNEFKGLTVIMALVNNWDLKDENNKIIYVPAGSDGGENQLHYVISDLGATFGKTGNFISHSRNEPDKFAKTKFIKGVEGGKVRFDYNGKNSGLFDDISVEQARWIGEILARLSDKQIEDAFRAANYSPEDVSLLAQEVRSRINELVNLSPPAPPAVATETGGR